MIFGRIFSVGFGALMAFVGLFAATESVRSSIGPFAISAFSFWVAYDCHKKLQKEENHQHEK
jgi:hypothetical protein